jgi:hypothetical protein
MAGEKTEGTEGWAGRERILAAKARGCKRPTYSALWGEVTST